MKDLQKHISDCDIVITGGSGWLASSILKKIYNERNQTKKKVGTIRVLVQNNLQINKKYQESGIDFFIGDITKIADCDKLMTGMHGAMLIHTAAIIHPRFSSDFEKVNYEGGKNVFQSAINNKLKRIVSISSNSPLGCNSDPESLFNEDSPYNPYMGYGKSKMKLEKFIRAVQNSGEIDSTIIRAPWFYGENQPSRQTTFYKMIINGKVPVVGSGNNLRSMVDVDKLAEAVFLCLSMDIAVGKTYWIADDKPYTMNHIISSVRSVLEEYSINCNHQCLKIPNFVSDVAYLTDRIIQGIGLYNQKIHVLSEMNKHIACDVTKAKKELGYKPATDIRIGLRKSILELINKGEL